MSFDWTAIAVGDLVLAAHQNQIKTNVDVVYSDLELTPYNWVYLPVDIGEEIDDADFQEMRDAIDYADTQNYCRSYNLAHVVVDNVTAKTGDNPTVYTGADGNNNPGYDGTNNPGVDTDYDGTYKGTNQIGVDTGHDSIVHSDQDGDIMSSVETGVAGTYKLAEYSGENDTYNMGNAP